MKLHSQAAVVAVLISSVALIVLPSTSSAGAGSLSGRRIHTSGSLGKSLLPRGMAAFPDAEPQYHNGSGLQCTDCHIAHASQQHALDPSSPGMNEPVPYAGSANPALLKAGDPLDLCLTCHDGKSFAPDVVGADANGLANRSAGFFGFPEELNPNGHDLGRNLPRDSGFGLCSRCHFSSGADMKVTCIDCHNPHGNHVARNLQWASDPEGTPPLGLFTNPGATGMQRYEAANVSYGTENSAMLREVTNMCLDCHHVFSGGNYIDPAGTGIHVRHPTYDSERNSTNDIQQGADRETTVPAHWEAGTGSGFTGSSRVRFVQSGATDYASARTVNSSSNGVFCLSCHKAHGSDQAFGLAWTLEPNGYGARNCDQCHLIANVP